MQELHPSLLCRQVFSHTSLPRLAFTAGSLQLPRLNYRYDTELCFSSGAFLRCLKPGELAERSTPMVSTVLLMETNFFFPRNVLHLVVLFILLKSKWNFPPS